MSYDLILTALDASSLQPIVFKQALETAKLHQAELKCLHCVEADINPLDTSAVPIVGIPVGASALSPSSVDLQASQQALEARLTKAKQWLQEYCQAAEQQGVKASFEVIQGVAGDQVCDLAQEWQADLIIVGRHGRTGLTEFLLGSVSNHVLHHAHCSVLVVQGESAVSGEST